MPFVEIIPPEYRYSLEKGLFTLSVLFFLILLSAQIIFKVEEGKVTRHTSGNAQYINYTFPTILLCRPERAGKDTAKPELFTTETFPGAGVYLNSPSSRDSGDPVPFHVPPIANVSFFENGNCLHFGLIERVEVPMPLNNDMVSLIIMVNATKSFDLYAFEPTANATTVKQYLLSDGSDDGAYLGIYGDKRFNRINMDISSLTPDNRQNWLFLQVQKEKHIDQSGTWIKYTGSPWWRHHPLAIDDVPQPFVWRIEVSFPSVFYTETAQVTVWTYAKILLYDIGSLVGLFSIFYTVLVWLFLADPFPSRTPYRYLPTEDTSCV